MNMSYWKLKKRLKLLDEYNKIMKEEIEKSGKK